MEQLCYIFLSWLFNVLLLNICLNERFVIVALILVLIIASALGFIVFWLRTALDLLLLTRQKVLLAEQERLLALQTEREIKQAYEQQRRINDLKDQFLLNVDHELRTPLTALGGFLELLNDYHEKLDPRKRAEMLSQALASQEVLVHLVTHILDATRLVNDIPCVSPEMVCVQQIVQEAIAQLLPTDVQAYVISLQIPEQIRVWADPQFLRQVLQNLLSNIFKYVPKQTKICIRATQDSPSSLVCLSVQDAGPGIPPEELALLFEKFVRLRRDLAGGTPGTGLGLYICKRFVEAMGGHIWVESSGRAGEGSRFCLTLPSSSSR